MWDEAHFHLSRLVNKQNFRYWSATNPKETYERPLHSSKVTIWWTISLFRILGPCFFKDGLNSFVTVAGLRYVLMLESILAPALARLPVKEETFFQQDGATCHTARASMTVVNSLFPNNAISRCGDILWPIRSLDLSTCNFFLCVYLKSQVLKSPASHTIQDLSDRIRKKLQLIPSEMLQRVMRDCKEVYWVPTAEWWSLSEVIFGKLTPLFSESILKNQMHLYVPCIHRC
jgi:hypothetical protein